MTQARRKKQNPTPCWVWFMVGVAVGAIGMGIYSAKESKNIKQQIEERLTRKKSETGQKKPPKPRFDFYTVLPEMEVVIPEEEIRKPPKIKKKPTDNKESASAPVYLLQMGSYRNYKDADRQKASLGLLGIEAEIQSVTIASNQGKTSVHRLRGGPYARQQAHALHRMLKQNSVSSILIRIKKD